jgi:hypothetical protein
VLDTMNGTINGTTKTAVFFSLQTGVRRINAWRTVLSTL